MFWKSCLWRRSFCRHWHGGHTPWKTIETDLIVCIQSSPFLHMCRFHPPRRLGCHKGKVFSLSLFKFCNVKPSPRIYLDWLENCPFSRMNWSFRLPGLSFFQNLPLKSVLTLVCYVSFRTPGSFYESGNNWSTGIFLMIAITGWDR